MNGSIQDPCELLVRFSWASITDDIQKQSHPFLYSATTEVPGN